MNSKKTYIYESPDGGHTVYRRNLRENIRELISEDEYAKNRKLLQEWNKIWEVKDSNPTLQHAVERVIMIYKLSEQHGKT